LYLLRPTNISGFFWRFVLNQLQLFGLSLFVVPYGGFPRALPVLLGVLLLGANLVCGACCQHAACNYFGRIAVSCPVVETASSVVSQQVPCKYAGWPGAAAMDAACNEYISTACVVQRRFTIAHGWPAMSFEQAAPQKAPAWCFG
jgi:hypothetical protein